MNTLTFEYSEDRFNKTFTLDYSLSHHAMSRCQQRGITKEMILTTIRFGTQISKQGFTYYYATKRSIPARVKRTLKREVNDLVIMVNEVEGVVVTCYWCYKGLIHLRKKPQSLLRYNAA